MIQLLQNDQPIDDKPFIEFLKLDSLKKKYSDEIEKLTQQLKKEFEDPVEYQAKYKMHDGEIIKDRNHRQVVNACIYPFSQKGKLTKLGYYFIRTEPLLEKGISDVDFVIESPKKQIAIFGEAKTSTVNASKIISEMKTRKKVIEENEQYLQQTHVPNSNKFEYVFGTHAIETRDLYARIVESNEKFVSWQYGGFDDNSNILSIYVPESVTKETREKVMHQDDELNRNLVRVNTNITYKNILPKSHPLAMMSILTWIDRENDPDNDDKKGTFRLKDLLEIFAIELEKFSNELIEKLTKKTIHEAVEIGFVRELDETDTYKIISQSSDPEARYEDLKRKWIDHAIKKAKNRKLLEKKLKLQSKMREEKLRIQPPIDSYFKEDVSGK